MHTAAGASGSTASSGSPLTQSNARSGPDKEKLDSSSGSLTGPLWGALRYTGALGSTSGIGPDTQLVH